MDQFDGHPGTAKLAQVLDKRTSQKTESPLTLDFGEIQATSTRSPAFTAGIVTLWL